MDAGLCLACRTCWGFALAACPMGSTCPGRGTRLQQYWASGGRTWAVRLSHPRGAAPTENLLPGAVLSEDTALFTPGVCNQDSRGYTGDGDRGTCPPCRAVAYGSSHPVGKVRGCLPNPTVLFLYIKKKCLFNF